MLKMFGRKSILVITTALAFTLVGCSEKQEAKSVADPLGPRYESTLADGIDFKKPGYPNFVADTQGISGYEPWGRWTDGKSALIKFKQPLPLKFSLTLIGGAYGPNIGQPVKVKVGTVEKEVEFTTDGFSKTDTHRIDFKLDSPTDTIEFVVPRPAKPTNGDTRTLGLSLIALKITQ